VKCDKEAPGWRGGGASGGLNSLEECKIIKKINGLSDPLVDSLSKFREFRLVPVHRAQLSLEQKSTGK
jgi:hypothetical protein